MVKQFIQAFTQVRRFGFVIPAAALIVVAMLALLASMPRSAAPTRLASATATNAASTHVRRFTSAGAATTDTPSATATTAATSAPQATPPPVPTQPPAPTATTAPAPTATTPPAPTWHVLGTWSGASSQTLITLDSRYQGDALQMVWACQITDAQPSWSWGYSAYLMGGGLTCDAGHLNMTMGIGQDIGASDTIAIQDAAGGQWTTTLEAYY